ncbi:TetR/AcrR family transcriptional regulator [Streptomyces sp. NPDC004539]|uniref:TetR/AcrR family transcriptional regulator n=1 Tax=Streptomyces sp. NPDC004539 TaxID=3154280 RepID=UPI00339F0C75
MTSRPFPPVPRPMCRDARRNHGLVLAAAGKVFSEAGAAAQIEDVARAAGVGVGTVYRRFGSREDLVAAVVAHRLAGWAAEARAALRRAESDPWEAFSGLLWSYARSCVADHRLLDLGCAGVLDLLTAGDGEHPGGLVALVEEVIGQGVAARVLPPELTARDVIALMTGIGGVAAVPGPDRRPCCATPSPASAMPPPPLRLPSLASGLRLTGMRSTSRPGTAARSTAPSPRTARGTPRGDGAGMDAGAGQGQGRGGDTR